MPSKNKKLPDSLNPPSDGTASDTDIAFEKSEDNLLQEGLKRTHTERFYFATRLYKINKMLSGATITHFTDK